MFSSVAGCWSSRRWVVHPFRLARCPERVANRRINPERRHSCRRSQGVERGSGSRCARKAGVGWGCFGGRRAAAPQQPSQQPNCGFQAAWKRAGDPDVGGAFQPREPKPPHSNARLESPAHKKSGATKAGRLSHAFFAAAFSAASRRDATKVARRFSAGCSQDTKKFRRDDRAYPRKTSAMKTCTSPHAWQPSATSPGSYVPTSSRACLLWMLQRSAIPHLGKCEMIGLGSKPPRVATRFVPYSLVIHAGPCMTDESSSQTPHSPIPHLGKCGIGCQASDTRHSPRNPWGTSSPEKPMNCGSGFREP